VKFSVFNDEVLYTQEAVTKVTAEDISLLKEKARHNARRRIRLCAHPSVEDLLHEMIIVHSAGNYVRPHRHLAKSESFHLIEGELVIALFDDLGAVKEWIPMGSGERRGILYYRLSKPLYHTVIPQSEEVVFHETTNGPFDRKETEFAPWAPTEVNSEEFPAYLEKLTAQFDEHLLTMRKKDAHCIS
jgi:cupin fold WbuC family metalloprotein